MRLANQLRHPAHEKAALSAATERREKATSRRAARGRTGRRTDRQTHRATDGRQERRHDGQQRLSAGENSPALQVIQPEGPSAGGVCHLPEDRLPHGESGRRQAHLPPGLLLLQALQCQAEPGQLCRPPRRVLLQAALPAALQEQRELRRGLRQAAAQGAVGGQEYGEWHQDSMKTESWRQCHGSHFCTD